MTETAENPAPAERPKQENIWLNIALNVVVPSMIMSKGHAWTLKLSGKEFDPAVFLIIALAFPLAYGIYDFITRKKYNFFSILGFVSIMITGGVGLMKLDKDWIAVKEAAVPALFGLAILGSLLTPYPLVRTFLFNPELFDVPKIDAELKRRGNVKDFDNLMVVCTWYLVGSFIMSAVLNYFLAKYFIQSETGTTAFTEELGKMTFWSYPVIMVPSLIVMMLALVKLTKGIKTQTGYELEDVLHAAVQEQAKKEAESKAAGPQPAESEVLADSVPDSETE